MLDALAATATLLLYAGILSGAGTAFAEASLHRSLCSSPFSASVMRCGALLTLAAALAGALILALRLGEFDETTLSAAFVSGAGAATAMQIAGSVLLLSALGDGEGTRMNRATSAALITLSLAFQGHAATAGVLAGGLAFIHVTVVAWWVGSLLLLRHAIRGFDTADIARLIQRFGFLALRAIAVLVVAGLVLLLVLVDFARDPWLTPYLRVIALKLAVVAVVLGVASYNRFRLTAPVRAGDREATAALQRTIDVELLGIGVVLLVTAILTTYTWPAED